MSQERDPRPADEPADIDCPASGAGRPGSSSAYRELLDALVHDLRGQLQGLIGVIDLIEEFEASALTERGHAWLARVRATGNNASAIVAGAARLARLESAPLRIGAADLDLVVANAVAAAEHDQGAPGSVEAAPGLPVVQADAELLGDAVRELVGNALRFGGGTVRISWDGGVVIEDGGPGIPDTHVAAMVAPFGHDATDPRSGAGVGLALARRVAERHGGHLTTGTGPDGGFRVTLTLTRGASGKGNEGSVSEGSVSEGPVSAASVDVGSAGARSVSEGPVS